MPLQLSLCRQRRKSLVPKRWLGTFCLGIDVGKKGLHAPTTLTGAMHHQCCMAVISD